MTEEEKLQNDYDKAMLLIAGSSFISLVRLFFVDLILPVMPLFDVLLFTLYSQMVVSTFSANQSHKDKCPADQLSHWYRNVMENLVPVEGLSSVVYWLLQNCLPGVNTSPGVKILGSALPVMANRFKYYFPGAKVRVQELYHKHILRDAECVKGAHSSVG
jgi:hypothetical protein